MPILVIGGTGFIGARVTRRLTIRGEEVVCMDINPAAASFADLGDKVKVVRLADAPRYHIYNSGGTPISLGALASTSWRKGSSERGGAARREPC